MKERPILFSAPMVRAILDGRKTQTRRVVKPQPTRSLPHTKAMPMPAGSTEQWKIHHPMGWRWDPGRKDGWTAFAADDGGDFAGALAQHCPYGRPRDRLYVKETWQPLWSDRDKAPASLRSPEGWAIGYVATDGVQEYMHPDDGLVSRCKPAIFMPRWASRIALEITDVRVERLLDISEADARAEGVDGKHLGEWAHPYTGDVKGRPFAHSFLVLWDQINGGRPGCAWSDNPWVWALTFRRSS